MTGLKYTENDEWVRLEGDTGVVCITYYAQDQLGDIVYVELPDIGKKVGKGDEIAVVESVKAAAEIYAPAGGEVTAVNEGLPDNPSAVNTDPLGEGWFYKLKISNTSELGDLMDDDGYKKYRDLSD